MSPAEPTIATKRKTVEDAAPIDPIAALAPRETVSYLVPGRVQIDLGGPAIEGPGGSKPIQVSIIDRQGGQVRAAVRLEHARFSLWSERGRLLGVVKADFNLQTMYRPNDETRAVLRNGAVVRRIKHEGKRSLVRYVGALELEGWIPDDMLVEEGPPRERPVRFPRPTRLRPQHVFSGAVIRREARWGGDQLAVVANAYTLDTVREVDDAWAVIAYDDADISVQGFVSRRDPPGRVHKPKDPDVAPQRITPTGKVPSGTCLHTQVKGEAIGYIVGDQDVMLDESGASAGWWTLTIDSPWGPIPFAAQGPTRTDLVGCAPSGSVPASALNAQPPAPAP